MKNPHVLIATPNDEDNSSTNASTGAWILQLYKITNNKKWEGRDKKPWGNLQHIHSIPLKEINK
jgi:hypothetical protein